MEPVGGRTGGQAVLPPRCPRHAGLHLARRAHGCRRQKIATADDWKTVRRPEILELFRKHVYGRVPATPYQKSFKVVSEDPNAMDGAATLKQVDITITAAGKSLTIHLALFVPNKVAKPVPTFLLICNRGPENIDPTRKTKSEFWPAEEVGRAGLRDRRLLQRRRGPRQA